MTTKYDPPKTVLMFATAIEYDNGGGMRVYLPTPEGKDQWVWVDTSSMSDFLSREEAERLSKELRMDLPA